MTIEESAPVLFICRDLIFTSKVTGTGAALKRKMHVRPSVAAALTEVTPTTSLAILDLSSPASTTAEDMKSLRKALPNGARLIAYGSHVDVERLREARAAGCDLVLPRSEFVKRLVELLQPDSIA